jgi:hypothetical protein
MDINHEDQEKQVLLNIDKLQTLEKELYKELENNPDKKNNETIINRINQLSQIRLSLFKTLNYNYQNLQKNVNTSRTELVELLTIVSIVEEELNEAKEQLNKLYSIKHNKMRMVEINTYYGKRYSAQAKLMKLIIFVSVLLLFLVIIQKKGLLPDAVTNVLIGIVFVVGVFLIIRRILDISWRDNMNFDAYNWNYDPSNQKPTYYDYNIKPPVFKGIDCIGDACCTDGMRYNSEMRKCITSV